ncbi:glycosyltransferase family 4 protein [Gammaproteobacteria bacterium]|nr:glycosyltransferase family 4 protein [Gammaproteobacteria bacterium]
MKTITLSANSSWYLLNFRKNTIRSFLDQGYSVTCISPCDPYTNGLKDLGCEWLPLKISSSGANPFSDIRVLAYFLFYYSKLKPVAAFHFTIKNNIFGTLAASLLHIPSINNISGLGTAYIHNDWKAKIARFLYRISLPLSFKIYCQNEDDFFLLSQLQTFDNKLKLLPGSGVDTSRFHPSLKVTKNYIKQKFRFIYAGRFLADKGLRELITAIENINIHETQCELCLIGFQDSENISAISPLEIESWSEIPGLFIEDATENIETILAMSDCLVLPSYREGMPRSILEACSMEIPIICTDVPGCKNIVTHMENGLLCLPKNVKSLENAMRQMLKFSSNDRELMGSIGRQRVVERFDEQEVILEANLAIAEAALLRQGKKY